MNDFKVNYGWIQSYPFRNFTLFFYIPTWMGFPGTHTNVTELQTINSGSCSHIGLAGAILWPQFRMWLKHSTKLMWWASLWGQKWHKFCESCSVVSNSLWPHGLDSSWNSPGQNTGVGSRFLLQGIFPTQGSNPGLPQCRWVLYHLSHREAPI